MTNVNVELRIGANQKQFNVDDSVHFDMDGVVKGFGKILGKPTTGLLDQYIVMLDFPLVGQRAILVQSSQLELVETDCNDRSCGLCTVCKLRAGTKDTNWIQEQARFST